MANEFSQQLRKTAATMSKVGERMMAGLEKELPTYSHRNGETDVPTEHGWYWVKGVMRREGDTYDVTDCIYLASWHKQTLLAKIDGEITAIGNDNVDSVGFVVGEWDCRWWGPVAPPWEQDV